LTVVGIAMVRDEADIIGPVVEHMLTQVDRVIVADNLSVDDTPKILYGLDIEVLEDPEPAYEQSSKMTALAMAALSEGADWIVPFDADEVCYSPFGRIADVLEGLGSQWLAASSELYDHVATADDPDEENPLRRMGWRRKAKGALLKVACRARPDLIIEQGNHGASYDGGTTVFPGLLVTRHFPYRSAEQFVRKVRNGAAAYAASDLPEEMGLHWRRYGQILAAHGEEAVADIFREWFWVRFPTLDDSLVFDPVESCLPSSSPTEPEMPSGNELGAS
jgi:glycosyltransferase involved in cell wall biosynthesis